MKEDTARNKISMAAVSVLIAFFLWMALKLLQPTNVRKVDLDVMVPDRENLAKRFILPSKIGPATILAEGPEDQIQKVDDSYFQRHLVAYLDPNELHVGRDQYSLKLAKSQNFPFTVRLESKNILLDVEEPKTRRLPITVEPSGDIDPSLGLAYNGATTEPNMVLLSGPRSAVDLVKKVRVFLSLPEVDLHSYTMATAEAMDEADNVVSEVTISPQLIKIKPRVAPAASSRTVLVEPRFLGQPAIGRIVSSYVVEPNQIAIQGPLEVIGRLNKISTRPVHIDNVRNSTTYDVLLDLPTGVRTYSTKTVQVHVVVEPSPVAAGSTP